MAAENAERQKVGKVMSKLFNTENTTAAKQIACRAAPSKIQENLAKLPPIAGSNEK